MPYLLYRLHRCGWVQAPDRLAQAPDQHLLRTRIPLRSLVHLSTMGWRGVFDDGFVDAHDFSPSSSLSLKMRFRCWLIAGMETS